MNNYAKQFTIIATIATASVITFLWLFNIVHAQSQACPEGSYEIGMTDDNQPICKSQPTGCAYAENIPVDSPKCVPSKEDQQHQQAVEPQKTQNLVSNQPQDTTPNTQDNSSWGK